MNKESLNLEYKGFKGSVEFSAADECFFGKVQGLDHDLIIYEGSTIEELEKNFREGVESYLATMVA